MTCKIEQIAKDGEITVFRLAGHIQAEDVSKIEELISRESSQVALDVSQLTLVDRDAVSYFALCKLRGIQLRNSPRFLNEWISSEQSVEPNQT